MPVYSYECSEHGDFDHSCRLAEWDDHKPCPKCGVSCEQVIRPAERNAQAFEPIVVHVDGQGNFRFPGSADARVPKHFQKVELKTIREIEQFERRVNTKLRSEADRHNSNEEIAFGEMKARLRSDLVQRMATMSPVGRAFAEFCIARNNARRRKTSEVGFHCEVLHFDQGNREPHNDERTGWRNRRG